MKISVITISYNQAEFLPACIESVAAQEGPFEHIIVDPGSTDGSHDIIEANRSHFSHIILEKDEGPADGLNRGFALATGDIFYYLNSDDIVLPGAFAQARRFFAEDSNVDVVAGNGYVIDKKGNKTMKMWSDPVSRLGLSHGVCTLIQPSMFMRKRAFDLVGGFNAGNRSCWDAELVRDMFEKGAAFKLVDGFWSGFRVYDESITGSGRLHEAVAVYGLETYQRLMGKKPSWSTKVIAPLFRVSRIIRHPERFVQKVKHMMSKTGYMK